MDILPIQASSVPCEQIFSSSKETTTLWHNQIKPHPMKQLQMLKYSTKSDLGLDFAGRFDTAQQTKELEKMNNIDVETPEDVNAFASGLLGIQH
jgi:hypothetical protein